MKRIIIAPDSFKGTLSAVQVCDIIGSELSKRYPLAEIVSIPVADGGEGTADAFLYALGGERVYCRVKGPLSREVDAFYALLPDGRAVIEMAQASGLALSEKGAAMTATGFGTGQLILDALDRGVRDFIIGIGGSATTDGGIGMLGALGVRFLDEKGESVELCGKGLSMIRKISVDGLDKRLSECRLTVLCDVENPLYGKKGAAYIYAPQKGATEEQVRLLDEGLENYAHICKEHFGRDYSCLPGSGAAGGMGFAFVAFLGAVLKSGADCVLEAAGFEEKVRQAELVIVGEGRLDSQSLMGKVPLKVAAHSKGKRVIAVVGICELSEQQLRQSGIELVIETNPEHLPFESIRSTAQESLRKSCQKILL